METDQYPKEEQCSYCRWPQFILVTMYKTFFYSNDIKKWHSKHIKSIVWHQKPVLAVHLLMINFHKLKAQKCSDSEIQMKPVLSAKLNEWKYMRNMVHKNICTKRCHAHSIRWTQISILSQSVKHISQQRRQTRSPPTCFSFSRPLACRSWSERMLWSLVAGTLLWLRLQVSHSHIWHLRQ